jgi:hypothetical protein
MSGRDFMLTVIGNMGARDVQVMNAETMQDAIALAERETGCRVDHGRSGIGDKFRPAIIIDAESGDTTFIHDFVAAESMQIVNPFKGTTADIATPKGEGK